MQKWLKNRTFTIILKTLMKQEKTVNRRRPEMRYVRSCRFFKPLRVRKKFRQQQQQEKEKSRLNKQKEIKQQLKTSPALITNTKQPIKFLFLILKIFYNFLFNICF